MAAVNKLGDGSWTGMFRLFGAQRQKREAELSSALGVFYENDQMMIDLVNNVLGLAEQGLREADLELGRGGVALTERVETAAAVLADYSAAFRDTNSALQGLAADLDTSITALG